MATYGAETKTENDTEKKAKLIHSLSLSSFIDPKSPWVLVPNGSYMGYFDWVPKTLRDGPWSIFAPLYLLFLITSVAYTKPDKFDFEPTNSEPYTFYWYYNLAAFLWMSGVLFFILNGKAGLFVISTYTIQSWTYLTARHGLTALAPFLNENHILLQINEMLRFLALVTATITFVVWNFILAPIVVIKFMDCPKKRRDFLKWMFSFLLVQVHGFNILFAILNAIFATPRRLFVFQDLWFSLAAAILYSCFYLFVLDRLGIHLYPIFSPRSKYFLITWTMVFGCYYGSYLFWNKVLTFMENY